MCGIAGIFTQGTFSAKELGEICLQFSRELRHRGPDDEGFVLFDTNGNAEIFGGNDTNKALQLPHISTASGTYKGALVHRRLSIISPGPEGHQPMQTANGKLWITYNGETFNYKALDAKYGIQNESNNDAETVLKLMAGSVNTAHQDLDGFHAFAVYNTESKQLHLYRDKTGVKPLYFSKYRGCFAFASETKALRKWAGFRAVNREAVFHMLAEGIQVPGLELIEGIQEISYDLECQTESLLYTTKFDDTDFVTPQIPLEEAVTQAVESRLMSDVPLGFAVSGGLDSAIIIGAARKKLGPDADLKLFSVVSDDAQSNESFWQEKVATFNRADWHKTSTEDFTAELLPKVVAATDIPAVAWNNIAQFELARTAREGGVTVFLNGQGADEIFGGYPDYVVRYFLSHPFYFLGKNMPLTSAQITREGLKLLAKRSLPNGFLHQQFQRKMNGWLGTDIKQQTPFLWQFNSLTAEQKMVVDYSHQKLRQMLRWEDLNGMAHHLESRNPFADNAILASWLKVSMKEKMGNGYTKGILRDAVKNIVPTEVLWRKDKKGFTVPDARLTWKFHKQWKDAFMSVALDGFSPASKREAAWKDLREDDTKSLQWVFRLSALAYYLENLKD
jgi:asparagine synthase (glutamine-hydrolysing)